VLVHGGERCLVANLAAANNYKKEHLLSDEMVSVWQKARFFYSAGFFLTVSPPSLLEVAQHALTTDKTMLINLSAPFICQFFLDPLMQVLPYADVVFGNESEAQAFGAAMKYEEQSVEAIAVRLAAMPKKNESRPRTVIITQGSQSTLVVYNGQVAHFDVPHIAKEKIIDTNGAGDGAFLLFLFSQSICRFFILSPSFSFVD
jgi:adenosine kinase